MFTKVACLAVCLCFAQIALGEELVLVENKKSPYRIVIGVDATMQDNYAAGLLQKYVEQMAGYKLPIVPDDGRPIDTEIIVGFNRHFDQLGLDVTKESFGPEEFLIKPVGRTLVIVGGVPRGVQYGVNSLLTDIDGIEVKEFVADGDALDLGAYGLAEPAATVTIEFAEEPGLQVRLSDETDEGVYLTTRGGNAVYLVDAGTAEMVSLDLDDVAQPPEPAADDTLAAGG